MRQEPSLKIQMLTPEEETDLIEQWIRTRDQKLLMKLINAFEPLVLKFARRFSSYNVPKDELLSIGNLALVEVANRFEPERGLKFSTFASHWIRGTMLVYIASNYFSFAMKSQRLKKVFFHLRSLIQQEQKRNGADGTSLEEIMGRMSEHFGIEQYRLEQIYYMIRQPNVSLDDPISVNEDGESVTISDMLARDSPSPEEAIIKKSADAYHRKLIYSTMERVLSERERVILTGQMLVEDTDERTLQDLAEQFDLSRERVRQIRNIAYNKLEKAIRRQCAHTDPRIFLNVSGRKKDKDVPVIESVEIVAELPRLSDFVEIYVEAHDDYLIDWTQLAA